MDLQFVCAGDWGNNETENCLPVKHHLLLAASRYSLYQKWYRHKQPVEFGRHIDRPLTLCKLDASKSGQSRPVLLAPRVIDPQHCVGFNQASSLVRDDWSLSKILT